MTKIRTRFAPSPTGPLHIGGVRTALYCYLFAKKNNGDFLLRIEDTDQGRYVKGAEEYVIESLKWLGISANEGQGIGGGFGPYRQSDRKHLYKKYAEQLIEKGFAYYAFDTSEELEKWREENPNKTYGNATRLEMNNSLTISKEELEKRLKNKVEREKAPLTDETYWKQYAIGWDLDADNNLVPNGDTEADYFNFGAEKMHYSYGIGLKLVMNNNFVVSADYGRAVDPQDGLPGVYIGMDYNF